MKTEALAITGTFLDEITFDIPSQNRGPDEKNITFEFSHFMSPTISTSVTGSTFSRNRHSVPEHCQERLASR